MTESEKARAYDKALEKAKKIHDNAKELRCVVEAVNLETIFPELKESEDERIRKRLIDFFEDWHENRSHCRGIAITAILAWLEKQGKSSDQIHYWTEEEIEPIINDYLRGAEHYGGMIGRLRCLKPKSLEKQNDCSVKWQKDTPNYKPAINHSVLMKTTQGIAEGEWQGEYWFQYRWSWTLKDSDVLAWMELSDLDEQGEQKPIVDFKAKDWYVSKVDGKIHDMTYNPTDKVVIKKGEKPATWSDEDEKMYKIAFSCIETLEDISNGKNIHADVKEWLKSIKDRIGG